jgi:dethiobiotin synthetase
VNLGAFVAGTDTGVGKTRVTAGLARAFAGRGVAVAALKPVASGAARIDGALRNADALELLAASNVRVPYEIVNPYCFEPPVSPHLAAREAGVTIDSERVLACYREAASRARVVLAEGAGGWLAPIGPARTMADIAETLDLPVLLVVGLRLGCLNHAALTLQAIRASRCRLAGWIGNAVDPTFARAEENVATLIEVFGEAPLATLAYGTRAEAEAVLLRPAAASLLQRGSRIRSGADCPPSV